MTKKIEKKVTYKKEDVLVVPRKYIFAQASSWHGINTEIFESCVQTTNQHKCFISRELAENDPTYKQIIPYMVFQFEDKYFVMQRKTTAGEQRLAGLYSLGIGGHIRKEDMTDDSIYTWAKREFNEEVNYSGELEIHNLGVLNDDSTDVGKVHLGLLLLLKGKSGEISIKDEHKSGKLMTLEECKAMFDSFETWSQFALSAL